MRLGLVSLAAVLLPIAAQAQSVRINERDTITTINTGAAANFSAASYTYDNTLHFNNSEGSESLTLNVQPSAMGINLSGIGGTSVTPTTAPDGTAVVNIFATTAGGSGQGIKFGWHGGDTGFLSSGVISGHNALTFNGGGINFVDSEGTFFSQVVIAGNWSSSALHTTPTYGAGYSVVDNFNFLTGNTYFTVKTTNYQGVNPTISFSLLGSAVSAAPEPAAWTMMILGFGLVGAALRRSRRLKLTGMKLVTA